MRPLESRKREYFLLFVGTWLIFNGLYPQWSPPLSVGARALLFGVYLVYFAANGVLLWRLLGRETWTDPPASDRAGLFEVLRRRRALCVLLGLALVLHVVYVFAVPAGYYRGDEPYHVFAASIFLHKAEELLAGRVPFPSVYLFRGLILAAGLGAFFGYRAGWARVRRGLLRWASVPAMVAAALLLAVWFLAVVGSGIRMPIELFEYPPLGKILYLLSFAVLGPVDARSGVGELVFAARLVQTGFALAGGLMVYFLTRLYRDEETAVLAAGMYLFLPVSFFFGNTADLDSGTLFFLLTVAYWFLRYEKGGRPEDLWMAVYFVGLGYNHKRVVMFTLVLFWVYWILNRSRSGADGEPRNYRRLFLYSWIALVPILPAFLQSLAFSARLFGWIPRRLLSFTDATIYLRLLSIEATAVVFVLFLVGAVWGLFARRDAWTKYLLVWFFIFYAIFTAWVTFPNYRFMFYFVPPLVMLAAQALRDALAKINRPSLAAGIVCAFFGYLIYSSALLGFPPPRERTMLNASPSTPEEIRYMDKLGERMLRRRQWWAGKGELAPVPWYAIWKR